MWDPALYSRFSSERQRPFFELLARIRQLRPSRVVDLGCGTGALTEVLADLWPEAQITGIDRSPEMLTQAEPLVRPKLSFEHRDIESFRPTGEDLLISNAALHWIPDHESLLLRFAKALPPGGTIAFQVPFNDDAPSHMLLRKLCHGPEWRNLLSDPKRHTHALSGVEYARMLLNHGFTVDAWETNYVQVLQGEDAVYEWMAGTTLRPIFAALDDRQTERFIRDYQNLLRQAYPAADFGTVFEFRRVFVIAQAPKAKNSQRSATAAAAEPVSAAEGDELAV
jgi:trans-aconitate 2-methyltransferase